jgi:DNA-binding transcriptional LysR family regulator
MPIFERHPRGVAVTKAGGSFLRQAQDALVRLNQAIKIAGAIGQAATGHLRIGIRSSIAAGFLRELLRAYSERHPDVVIQFVAGPSPEHISLVRKRRLDVRPQRFFLSTCSIIRRIASDRGGLSGCRSAHASIASRISGESLIAVTGSRPVAGRPLFFGSTPIDFGIIGSTIFAG